MTVDLLATRIEQLASCQHNVHQSITPLRRCAIQKMRALRAISKDLQEKQFTRESEHIQEFLRVTQEERRIIHSLKEIIDEALLDLTYCYETLEKQFVQKTTARAFFSSWKNLLEQFSATLRSLQGRIASEITLGDSLNSKGAFFWKKWIVSEEQLKHHIAVVIAAIHAEKALIKHTLAQARTIQQELHTAMEHITPELPHLDTRSRIFTQHLLQYAEENAQDTVTLLSRLGSTLVDTAVAAASMTPLP